MRMLLFLLALSLSIQSRAGELWLYCAQNLWVDKNIDNLEQLFARAGKAGYTHVLLTDSKSAKLGDMDARYFKNVERVKKIAAANHLEIVPAVFPIGYSNDILWHDPNLVEALPVRDVEMVVENGVAKIPAPAQPLLKGGDFSDLKQWSWYDKSVEQENGAVRVRGGGGNPARIVQKLALKPFRRYHLTVRVKTTDFKGAPEVKILADNFSFQHNHLGAKPTQDWTVQHVVFDSLQYTNANLYLGSWDARAGELWFDDVQLEETVFVNLVRRPGAPLTIVEGTSHVLQEGTDFAPLSDPKMGRRMWPGSYDIYHEPPQLKVTSNVPEGARLKVSCYHAVTVHDDQANICPSEPKTLDLLRDQAKRVHEAWGAKRYMMSHDEIRVLNWCGACQARKLTAGQILADNVRACAKILREAAPDARIYVWSDMFDPNHNAHDNYYLVRGTLAGSWEGLDKDITIVPWYFEKRAESLKFFADRGHHQVIAGYYDHNPAQIKDWLKAAEGLSNVDGVMYTTWVSRFNDLESFAEAAK
ncbi:MAG TPA: hypothetical protein VM680_01165 [Verrucomicrobiae bacterium]|nr:hypothetical protein [Verrucomicrobiae bacterium]